jgi:hypothetical protein
MQLDDTPGARATERGMDWLMACAQVNVQMTVSSLTMHFS